MSGCLLVTACGSDSDAQQKSLNDISGNWEIDLGDSLNPDEIKMNYLSISNNGDVDLYGLDEVNSCYKHVSETVAIVNNVFQISTAQGNITLSLNESNLYLDTGLAIMPAEPSSVDFEAFNLCSEEPIAPHISLEDIQGDWKIVDVDLENSPVFLHYFSISQLNHLTSYHFSVDENCYELEQTGEVTFIASGEFNLTVGNSNIAINYLNGNLQLNDGNDVINASATTDKLNQLAICGQLVPDPEPAPELTLNDIKGSWQYQSNDEPQYVTITETGLFKRYNYDVQECYTSLSGAISIDDNNRFTVSPSGDDAFTIELTQDGEVIQSSSILGQINFNRTDLTEEDFTPACAEPIVYDSQITLEKLQGSFGGNVEASHRPFTAVTGNLLSFMTSESVQANCYQRQGFWLEDLGQGQFRKTEILDATVEVVGFNNINDTVTLVNINSGLTVELGDFVSTDQASTNALTKGINMESCEDNSPDPSHLVGSWYHENTLDYIDFHLNGDQLISTKYSIVFDCYDVNEPQVVDDLSILGALNGGLALDQNNGQFYNRVLEKNLPPACINPDLNLTLEDVAGLWKLDIVTTGDFYFHITADGSKTLYSNKEVGACLNKYRSYILTRQDNGEFKQTLDGSDVEDTISFAMPSNNKLNVFVDAYNHLEMTMAEESLVQLNARVCH